MLSSMQITKANNNITLHPPVHLNWSFPSISCASLSLVISAMLGPPRAVWAKIFQMINKINLWIISPRVLYSSKAVEQIYWWKSWLVLPSNRLVQSVVKLLVVIRKKIRRYITWGPGIISGPLRMSPLKNFGYRMTQRREIIPPMECPMRKIGRVECLSWIKYRYGQTWW